MVFLVLPCFVVWVAMGGVGVVFLCVFEPFLLCFLFIFYFEMVCNMICAASSVFVVFP